MIKNEAFKKISNGGSVSHSSEGLGETKNPHVIIIDLGLFVNKLPGWQMQHYLAILLTFTYYTYLQFMYP